MNTTIYTFEKGQYCIGDPAYILPSSIYEGIWGELYNYTEGMYSAHGYPLLIYETHYDENTTTYRDNIDRKYIIKTNNICIIPIEIVKISNITDDDNQTQEYEAIYIDVLSKMTVYHSNKYLYINTDDNPTFSINIGQLETPDNISDNGSETNSIDEFVKEYSKQDYEHEYDIENSSDEEFNADTVMKDMKKRLDKNHRMPIKTGSESDDENEEEDDDDDNQNQNKSKKNKIPQTTFSFFKKTK